MARACRVTRAHEALRICSHCGGEGPHYVPPCLGDPGFYSCASPEEIAHITYEHAKERLEFYALYDWQRRRYQQLVDEYEEGQNEH